MKKLSMLLLTLLLVVGLSVPPITVDAKPKTKLSTTKTTVYKGDTKTIKLKNNTKKVKWSVSNKNIVKIVKKNNKQVKIKAMNAGTTYVKAKVGKKTYKCKVVVKNLTPEKIIRKEFIKQFKKQGIKEAKPGTLCCGAGVKCTLSSYKSQASSIAEWEKDYGTDYFYIGEITDIGDGWYLVMYHTASVYE